MSLLSSIAPQWAVKRHRARHLLRQLELADARLEKAGSRLRAYDAAKQGRRLSRWLATDEGPAGGNATSLRVMRARARNLGENNPYFANALDNIQSEVIGGGIIPTFQNGPQRLRAAWRDWAESTDCDADGRLTYYGIQDLVMREIAESGECLIRFRLRRSTDGLPVPFQLQVLEPDYLADDRLGLGSDRGGNVRSGIAFDRRGRRSAYHLYKEHPSTQGIQGVGLKMETVRVPASEVIHLYRLDRAGQIRGVPWCAPVTTRLRFLDDYEDAALERARVAACFAAFIVEPSEDALPKAVIDGTTGEETYPTERLEPGIVEHLPPGKDVRFGAPTQDTGYEATVKTNLRAIASGMHLTYEMLTEDLSQVNFTSGRMGGLNLAKTVNRMRRNIAVPHLCDGVMKWFLEMARFEGLIGSAQRIGVTWTPPRADMVDPTKETAAMIAKVRGGFVSMPQAIREQGGDPDQVRKEIKEWNDAIDADGITLDTDPRNQSAAGQTQGSGNDDTEEADDGDTDEAESEGGDGDAAEAAE